MADTEHSAQTAAPKMPARIVIGGAAYLWLASA